MGGLDAEGKRFLRFFVRMMKNVFCILGLYRPNLKSEFYFNYRTNIIWYVKGIERRRLAVQIGDFRSVL